MISDIRTQPQVDETSNLLVTFGLHGKDILINDMRVSGNGVAIACECISQASSPSCTFFKSFQHTLLFRWVCAVCSLVGMESLAVAAAGPLTMLSATLIHALCFLLHSHATLSCYSHSSSVPLSRVPLSSLSLSTLLFFFQDKGYFESKIISVGTWSVGVCKQEAHAHSDLSKVSSLLSSLLCRVLNFPRLSALRRSLNMSRNVCV